MALARRDREDFSYADYLDWPEDARYEIVDGVAYMMAPTPSVDHQTVAFEVGRQIGNALEGHPCRVLPAPVDVLLPHGDEADEETRTVVQPDLLVVCDPTKLTPRGVRGAPDWVLEVISPATAGHDQIVKLAAYERAGVREFWLVHPVDRLLIIYRHDGEGYGRPDIRELTGETPLGALESVTVRWEPIVACLLGGTPT